MDEGSGLDVFSLMGGMACDGEPRGEETCPSPRHDPEEESRLVAAAEEREQGLQCGKVYYLICQRWYTQWRQWTRSPQSADRPPQIENNSLLESVSEIATLKQNLQEHQDFVIVSGAVWELLHGWYRGGPAIPRRAVPTPSGSTDIEVYCLRLLVHKSTDLSASPKPIFDSKVTTVEDFKKHACEELGLDSSKVRIWDYFNKKRHYLLEQSLDKTLESCTMVEDNDILLETQLEDGTWPRETIDKTVITNGNSPCLGVVGLQNLGNTCFMNSSIQCLSSVAVFREHFRTDSYKEGLNRVAFKTQGKLAEEFSKLLKDMWTPGASQVAPREFKYQIGQFAEQFTGYRQHDSMEFIEYLLDGLKEDLNSVRGPKPFVELKEAEGRTDDVVAEEAKHNYLIRNNSYIDELFLGFYKSTVQCTDPGCDRVSVKFDPFLSIKVPLTNSEQERKVTFAVTVVAKTLGITSHKVQVVKAGTAQEIIDAAAEAAGIASADCVLVEVYMRKIYKCFDAADAVDSIRSNDVLVVYEADDIVRSAAKAQSRYYSTAPEDSSDVCACVIYLRRNKPAAYSSGRELIGLPLVLSLPRESTAAKVSSLVKAELDKHIRPLPEGWSVFWTAESSFPESCTNQLGEGDEVVRLHGKPLAYIIVEWPEAVVPEAAVQLGEATVDAANSGFNETPEPAVNLSDCIKLFTETDTLSADDAWYCNKCKEHREALKKMEFWSLPPVLLLQLKRFTYTSYSRDRIDTNVAFPLEGLDMQPFVMQNAMRGIEQVFDLVALSLHGGSQSGGHYVAYGRSSENGRWHYYNDSFAKEVEPSEVAKEQSGAYVLFYLRRDYRPASWGPPFT